MDTDCLIRSPTEQMTMFDLGEQAIIESEYDISKFTKIQIEEVGRTIKPFINKEQVPSLLSIQQNESTISFEKASKIHDKKCIKTVAKLKRDEIITQVKEYF